MLGWPMNILRGAHLATEGLTNEGGQHLLLESVLLLPKLKSTSVLLRRILYVTSTKPAVAGKLPDTLQGRLHVLEMGELGVHSDEEL